MDKKLKFVKANKNSDIYESDKYRMSISIEGLYFNERGSKFNGEDENEFVYAASVQIQNKLTGKKSSKLKFFQPNIIDIINDYLLGSGPEDLEVKNRIEEMFKRTEQID